MRETRKTLAGLLIRLAHRIYPPRTTFRSAATGRAFTVLAPPKLNQCRGVSLPRADTAIYTAGPVGPAMQEYFQRLESRGWTN